MTTETLVEAEAPAADEAKPENSRPLGPIEKLAYVAAKNASSLATERFNKARVELSKILKPILDDATAMQKGLEEVLSELGIPADAAPKLNGETLEW